MLIAIITGIIAAAVVIAVVVVIFMLSHRGKDKRPEVTKKQVSQVSSVGVKSTMPGAGGGKGGAHVKKDINTEGGLLPNFKNRFIAAGAFGAFVFGLLGVRAYQIQVQNSDTFSAQSEENATSTVSTPAPRGYIYDRDGKELVKNRTSLTVLADSDVAEDNNVVARLSATLGVPRPIIKARIKDSSSGAQSQRVVATDVRFRDVAFITEHSDAFSGVDVETRTVREYPYAALASHVLGYVGEVSEEELADEPRGRNIQSGDNVGKSGIEQTYDSLLAGEHGQKKVLTDAEGNVHSVVSETKPSKGSDIYLTLAAPVQYVADTVLKNMVAPEGDIGSGKGTAASIVCMDLEDGGIVALANYPTYNPENFVGGVPEDIWDLYNTEESHYPLVNRAIAGAYPAASTYKAFTSLAALTYKIADDKTEWTCGGSWDGFGSGDIQNCWQLAGHGTLDLHGGIVNSCDVVFYEIAKAFWDAGVSQGGSLSDTAMQDIIAEYDFGKKTGIDLNGELTGRIPTPEWKAEYFRDVPEEAQWKGGDMTNMAIGQGYVLVTPIQQAVAYGAIACGKLLKPHLLREVRNSKGEVVISKGREEVGTPEVSEENLKYVREALKGVAETNFSKKFAEQDIDGACKTGTAEVAGKNEFTWLCAYAPYDNPRYVVAGVNEESGESTQMAYACIELLGAAVKYSKGELSDVGAVAASSGKTVEKQTTETHTSRTN